MDGAYLQTEDDEEKPAFVSDSRTVNLAGGVPADKTAGFATNNIKTAKYNLITFFPIFLFEMFSRAAYLYFLAQVCLNAVRSASVTAEQHAELNFPCDMVSVGTLCTIWPTSTRPGWPVCLHYSADQLYKGSSLCLWFLRCVVCRLASHGGVLSLPSQAMGPQQHWHLC